MNHNIYNCAVPTAILAGVCVCVWPMKHWAECDLARDYGQSAAIQGCARFAENWSELTKTWSSGATEFWVWIGNCNVKVWKSTEDKLHNYWRSVKFEQNEPTPECDLARDVLILLKFQVNSQKLGVQVPQNIEFE